MPSTLAAHTLMTYSIFCESYALPELRFTSDGVRTLPPQRFDAINRQSFSQLLERDDFFRIVIPPYLIFVA